MPTSDLPIGFLSGFFGWLSQKRIHGTNGERYIYLLIYLFEINPIHVGILYIYIYISFPWILWQKNHMLRIHYLTFWIPQAWRDSISKDSSSMEGFRELKAYGVTGLPHLQLQWKVQAGGKRISKKNLHVPPITTCITDLDIHLESHLPTKKSMAKRHRKLNMCLFQGGIFPEKPIHQSKPHPIFFDVVFSAAKITTWSPIYSPVLVPAATLHPRLRHILWKPPVRRNEQLETYGCWTKNKGTPKWMVKIMENPIKMDDLGGKPTIFGNNHIVFQRVRNFPKEKKKTKQCAFCSLCEEQMPGSFQPYLPPQKK